MSTNPSIQNNINPEAADLLARAESQFQMSREIVTAFLQQRQEGGRAILALIESNKELAAALRLAFTENGVPATFSTTPNQKTAEMDLALTLVPPRTLEHDKEYFSHAKGQVLLEFCKAYLLGSAGVTVSEIAAATSYNEGTVKGAISELRTYTLGPNYSHATEIGRDHQIVKMESEKWALTRINSALVLPTVDMEFARTLVPPHHLKKDKEYFNHAPEKFCLNFVKLIYLVRME